jgi:secreted trypsin-like serine protease
MTQILVHFLLGSNDKKQNIAGTGRQCGTLEGVGDRLQGGSQGKVPWIVRLWKQTEYTASPWKAICGGSLVLDTVVLTGAHCLTSLE